MRGGHTGLYSLVIWAMVGHMGGGGGGSYGWRLCGWLVLTGFVRDPGSSGQE